MVCPKANYPGNGMVRVWSPRVGIRDMLDPELTAAPTRSLLSGQPVSEIQYVTFKATDWGGGIKSMGLLVDGVPHGDRLVDPASATCKEPYTKVVPCSLSVEPTVVVDTRELANGPHSVRVTRRDPIPTPSWRGTAGSPMARTRAGQQGSKRGSSRAARAEHRRPSPTDSGARSRGG